MFAAFHAKTGLSALYTGSERLSSTHAELLLNSENRVLCHLGDSEFDNGLGWNPDLLLCLGIKTRTRLSFLFHQLAKAGQDEFAVLFSLLVREGTERIEKYSSCLFIGLCGCGKCGLKFCFCHVWLFLMAAVATDFKERRLSWWAASSGLTNNC